MILLEGGGLIEPDRGIIGIDADGNITTGPGLPLMGRRLGLSMYVADLPFTARLSLAKLMIDRWTTWAFTEVKREESEQK